MDIIWRLVYYYKTNRVDKRIIWDTESLTWCFWVAFLLLF